MHRLLTNQRCAIPQYSDRTTCWTSGDRILAEAVISLLVALSKPLPRPTHPLIHWVLMERRPSSEADDSPPSSITAKECMELYLHSSSEIKLLSWSKNALKEHVGSQQPKTGPPNRSPISIGQRLLGNPLIHNALQLAHPSAVSGSANNVKRLEACTISIKIRPKLTKTLHGDLRAFI